MPDSILTATYASAARARAAMLALRDAGVPEAAIDIQSPQTDAEAARAEQRVQAQDPREERGLVMTNPGLWGGAVTGGALGMLLGAIIFAIGIVVAAEPPGGTLVFLIASLVGGAAAGSVAGALLGAFRSFKYRQLREEIQLQQDVVLKVTTPDQATSERALQILRTSGAHHVERSIEQRRAG